jgi:hypothetical protein
MANISVSNTFVNGTTADATQVNQNFTDIINGTSDGTKDLSISALTCAGNVSMNGNVTLGNASGDDVTVTGSLASNLPIKTDGSYDIGSTSLGLDIAYFGDGGGNTVGIDCPAIASNFIFTLPAFTMTMPTADGAAKDYMQTDGSGAISFVGGPGITTKTGAYTVTTADKFIDADASGGDFTLTLYAASGNAGRTLFVKNTGASGAVTIDGNSSETIDGDSAIYLSGGQSVEIKCDGTNWVKLNYTGLVGFVVDQKSGAAGGTFTQDAWQTRDLNTTSGDFTNFASLSSNAITLDPGVYDIEGACVAFQVNDHKTRVYNTSDTALVFEGDQGYVGSSESVQGHSTFRGRLSLTASKVIEVQHYCLSTKTTTGFGRNSTIGTNQVFSQVKITKHV